MVKNAVSLSGRVDELRRLVASPSCGRLTLCPRHADSGCMPSPRTILVAILVVTTWAGSAFFAALWGANQGFETGGRRGFLDGRGQASEEGEVYRGILALQVLREAGSQLSPEFVESLERAIDSAIINFDSWSKRPTSQFDKHEPVICADAVSLARYRSRVPSPTADDDRRQLIDAAVKQMLAPAYSALASNDSCIKSPAA